MKNSFGLVILIPKMRLFIKYLQYSLYFYNVLGNFLGYPFHYNILDETRVVVGAVRGGVGRRECETIVQRTPLVVYKLF